MTAQTYSGQSTLSPGYYSGGISLPSKANVTLSPGIYAIGNGGLSIGKNSSLTADGVMFYIVGTGSVSLGGGGNLTLTPLDTTDPNFAADSQYQGISIFQSRTDSQAASFGGNSGTTNITGTLYFPDNEVDLGGNSNLTAGNQLIANTVSLSGNSTITINYQGSNPAPGTKVFLVQ